MAARRCTQGGSKRTQLLASNHLSHMQPLAPMAAEQVTHIFPTLAANRCQANAVEAGLEENAGGRC